MGRYWPLPQQIMTSRGPQRGTRGVDRSRRASFEATAAAFCCPRCGSESVVETDCDRCEEPVLRTGTFVNVSGPARGSWARRLWSRIAGRRRGAPLLVGELEIEGPHIRLRTPSQSIALPAHRLVLVGGRARASYLRHGDLVEARGATRSLGVEAEGYRGHRERLAFDVESPVEIRVLVAPHKPRG